MEERNIVLTQYELVQIYEILCNLKKGKELNIIAENQKAYPDTYFIDREKGKIETIENLIEKLGEQL